MTPAAPRAASAATASPRASRWPAILCWIVVMLEGFDLVVLGAVIPTLLATGHVGFTAESATAVATLSLVGVGVGAAGVGFLADRLGRRVAILTCVVVFSIFTVLVPFAPNVLWFAVFRLLAGVGLGAVLPTALTYVGEYSGSGSTARATTLTMTGYHTGAVLAALLAVLAGADWQLLFLGGGIVGFLLLPVLWLRLPESPAFLAARGTGAAASRAAAEPAAAHPAGRSAASGPAAAHPAGDPAASAPAAAAPAVARGSLFSGGFARVTIGVWVASFMGLLLVYGLNTWLPTIMEEAGYRLSASLVMLLVLNLGAVVGLVVAGRAADRHGTRPMVLLWFGAAAVLLALLSVRMENPVVLHLAIFATGAFVFSAQVLVYAYVSSVYPAEVRGTALGLAAGVGRLGAIVGPFLTGALVAAGIAYPWGFYLFAAVAVLGVLAMAAVPRAART
ncbi:MFS transporter [Brevibacterium ihuae]|uniref:MFS transporter n=1 Tax=Brevibacterium ihuae TaxID=1631743 RepID=UPI000C772062|nr:MFS transporter [Brevibacterium ihuae]